MDSINNILAKKKVQVLKPQEDRKKLELQRPINTTWEVADEFAKYVRLSTPFVLKLFKIYGQGKVLGLRSYLKDSQCAPEMYAGMVVNRLKKAVL